MTAADRGRPVDVHEVSESSGVGPSNNWTRPSTLQNTRSSPSCEMTKAIAPGTFWQKR